MFGFGFTFWKSALARYVGGGGAPFIPSLKFNDARNSQNVSVAIGA